VVRSDTVVGLLPIDTEELLGRMTADIVAAMDPLRVILFGSRARGEAKAGSDVDLIVVEEDVSHRRNRVGVLVRLLSKYALPADVLLYSREEFEHWRDRRNHVLYRATREGRVLHERA